MKVVSILFLLLVPYASTTKPPVPPPLLKLSQPVHLQPEERAWLKQLPPLTLSLNEAPPMVRLDPKSQSYTGLALEVWQFISDELGLDYSISAGAPLSQSITAVQTGNRDAFIPLSLNSERAALGLFTQPFYNSYYAVIQHRDRPLAIKRLDDLKNYTVGVIEGFVLEPELQRLMPENQLVRFQTSHDQVLYNHLYDGTVDAIVHNKDMFTEGKYTARLFELDAVYSLHQYPREYRFYFADTTTNKKLVALFDRYLTVLNTSAAEQFYKTGEKDFIEAYLKQKHQHQQYKKLLIIGLMLFIAYAIFQRRSVRLAQKLKQSNQLLKAQARIDDLTGLSNRHYFYKRLQQAHNQYLHYKTSISLLFIDVDYFKAINDTYGHLTGDNYLKKLAQAIKKALPKKNDTVARVGGEEFICLLVNTSAEHALRVAQAIQQQIARLHLSNPRAKSGLQTVSIGLVTLLQAQLTTEDLVYYADQECYRAKAQGRNTICSICL